VAIRLYCLVTADCTYTYYLPLRYIRIGLRVFSHSHNWLVGTKMVNHNGQLFPCKVPLVRALLLTTLECKIHWLTGFSLPLQTATLRPC
jgi:hypothetical protein